MPPTQTHKHSPAASTRPGPQTSVQAECRQPSSARLQSLFIMDINIFEETCTTVASTAQRLLPFQMMRQSPWNFETLELMGQIWSTAANACPCRCVDLPQMLARRYMQIQRPCQIRCSAAKLSRKPVVRNTQANRILCAASTPPTKGRSVTFDLPIEYSQVSLMCQLPLVPPLSPHAGSS